MTPPTRREHEYPADHPRRPAYFPDITLECGPRETIETHGIAFVQSLGYVV